MRMEVPKVDLSTLHLLDWKKATKQHDKLNCHLSKWLRLVCFDVEPLVEGSQSTHHELGYNHQDTVFFSTIKLGGIKHYPQPGMSYQSFLHSQHHRLIPNWNKGKSATWRIISVQFNSIRWMNILPSVSRLGLLQLQQLFLPLLISFLSSNW